MYSAASCQVLTPPQPMRGMSTPLAMLAAHRSETGFNPGPLYPPKIPMPSTEGNGLNVSRSIPANPDRVFVAVMASAPASLATRARETMSVTFGVSFAITGNWVASLTQLMASARDSGSWPNWAPFSSAKLGQLTFISKALTPCGSRRLTTSCHSSGLAPPIMLAMIGRLG